jgi:hypothetical protein
MQVVLPLKKKDAGRAGVFSPTSTVYMEQDWFTGEFHTSA